MMTPGERLVWAAEFCRIMSGGFVRLDGGTFTTITINHAHAAAARATDLVELMREAAKLQADGALVELTAEDAP